MPIYEFVCGRCEQKFEKIVFSHSAKPECPQCESGDVEKIPSVFAFSSGGRMVGSSAGSSCDTCKSHNCAECR